MKVLLTGINAKFIHSNPAIYSLAAYAGAHLEESELENCRIELAEYTINQRKEEIIADIYKKKPDILAFSCYIWNWALVQEILSTLHKLYPELPIWLGGPEVSFTPEEILKTYPFLAGIMVGEGEETFLELCRFYLKKRVDSLEESGEIQGTVTPRGRGLQRNFCCLDEIPFFYESIKEEDWSIESFANRILYYESSRGCPYRCSYCLSSIDKELRLRNLRLVKRELLFFLKHKVPQVKFIDRTFNASHEHAREIWKYILENDNGITNFHFEIAADIITKEELELLAGMRPGLIQLEIGVQSTNPLTLREINRPMNFEKVSRVVEQIREMGNIHQHLDLIAGLPHEDYASFRDSFNQVYSLKPQQLQLGFLKVLKGSPIWERTEEYGIVHEDRPPYEVLYTNWLSYEEVRRLKQIEEVLEIYYNSGQFSHTMAMLEKEFDSPFEMYERLASFIHAGKDLSGSSSRSRRCQILLSFIREQGRGEEMYQELLTFDLYLREKMKTRPDFCSNPQEIKEESRQFYKQEEQERRWLLGYEAYNSKQMAKMTHLEAFHYSVWEKGNCSFLKKPAFVLFDCRSRSPLTSAALVQVVGIKEE